MVSIGINAIHGLQNVPHSGGRQRKREERGIEEGRRGLRERGRGGGEGRKRRREEREEGRERERGGRKRGRSYIIQRC